MAGIEPALLVPDLLAVAGQIKQLVGADRDLIEPVTSLAMSATQPKAEVTSGH